jgi:hypothetical protein
MHPSLSRNTPSISYSVRIKANPKKGTNTAEKEKEGSAIFLTALLKGVKNLCT